MQEKNYYIVLPITPTNIVGVYGFMEEQKDNLLNVGNNKVIEIIPNLINSLEASFRLELKETLVDIHRTTLEGLGALLYESAEAYHIAYPTVSIDFDTNI